MRRAKHGAFCREEIVLLAKKIEEAGASIINTGIGWHEARIPTIATSVPRAGFSWVTKKLKGEVRKGAVGGCVKTDHFHQFP